MFSMMRRFLMPVSMTRGLPVRGLSMRGFPVRRFPVRELTVREDCAGVTGSHLAVFNRQCGLDTRAFSNAPAPAEGSTIGYKSLQTMPGRGSWTTIYWLFIKGYVHKLHLLQIIEQRNFGQIWRTGQDVNLADSGLIEQVLRHEGKYPMRSLANPWKEYRTVRGLANGVITAEGEEWHRLRAVLNKRMLKVQDAALYEGVINEVVSDLVDRIRLLRVTSESGVTVHNITTELQRYTFEAIAAILFEIRLGCLEPKIPEETQKFINSVIAMFRALVFCDILPKWTRSWLPFWKRYILAWDNMFDFAIQAVDKKMAQIKDRLERGQSVEGQYLTYLLANEKMSQSELYSNITELLLAGVDTTANTLSWALYCLAKHPELQESVFREMCNVGPAEQIPTAQDLSRMPLLRAIIKETLRMYPVVPNGFRILDTDIVLGGYTIPRKTHLLLCHYATSHNEQEFPNPHVFLPERWIRGSEKLKHHPFSSLPFGYGVRGCLGRRIAELEMQLTLARLLKQFRLKLDPGMKEVPAKSRIVLIPEKPINLQFLDRQ
ncbi:sterol 26-hydroxylase, mitochondrial-like [Heptranchias perlo]|uniref:sterol 26-hydroxylase, mitochondrial-like n=1 Tax=Heptranchias perlo TaxID=212740 RepID=UPI00355A0C8E